VSDLSDKYAELLSRYLEGEGESALTAAYDASREAAASGMGLFEFQAAMRTAIESLFETKIKPEEAWRPGPVQTFMAECLGAFDLAFGGLREAGKHAAFRADQARAETSRAQEALEATQLNYKRLFEGHPEPMWVYDLETLAFLDVNDAAVQNYGFSREEFMAMTIKDIRPASEVAAMLKRVTQSDVLERSTGWVHRTKDGKLMDVEITSHGVDFGGRKARFVMAQDVTDRIRLEQQVRQSQRLESLGQLAGGVAHDFNNLLTAVVSSLELIQTKTAEDLTRRLADVALRAAMRGGQLTHQLLSFSRRQNLRPTVVLSLIHI